MTINNMVHIMTAGQRIANSQANNTSASNNNHSQDAKVNNAGPVTSAAVRRAGNDLFQAVRGFTLSDRRSAFSRHQGVTSDSKVATVSVNNSLTTSFGVQNLTKNPIELEVRQTAQAQINAGQAMNSFGRGVSEGVFNFEIETSSGVHSFSLTVGASDTNETIQRRMALAINQRDIGITASAETSGATQNAARTTALTLTANNTGTNSAFTINDTSGLTAAMSVANATQEARNAVYSTDGVNERTSQSNTVSLAAGVTATFQDTGTTTVSLERDPRAATDAVTNFVNSVNSALNSVNASDGRGSARFVSDLQGMTRSNSAALSRVGITVSRNGQMTIDTVRLERAARDGSLEQLFASGQFGINARAERIASNATTTNTYNDMPAVFSANRSSGQINFQMPNMNSLGWLFDFKV